MELASAQATQGADECSMRHGSVEDQIDSTDSMDSFASAARTASRSSSPGTGVDISRLSPLPSPGALPGSSQSSSLESGDPYPFPSARPEGWKKESSFDEGNARHQAVLRILCQLVVVDVDQGASVKTTTKLDPNCKPAAIKGRARQGNTPPVSFWSLRGVDAALTAAPPGAVAGADEEQQEAAANLGQFAAAQLHLKTNPSGDTILLNFWLALFGDCFGRRAKSPATAARRFLEGDSLTAFAPGRSIVFSTGRRGKLGNIKTEWTKNDVPVALPASLFDGRDSTKLAVIVDQLISASF